MRNVYLVVLAVMAFICSAGGAAHATPSTQIWIPSTDVQPVGTIHLGVDNFTTVFKQPKDGGHQAPVDVGATVGLLETSFMYVEGGLDLKEATDDPLYFNAKLGIKEDSLAKYFPAIAIGGYDFGTKPDTTAFNIIYVELAKTLASIGRFTAGYYAGNDKLLRDAKHQKENDGVLLSFDRTLAEISDKLWFGVDYMSGRNSYGALSFGVSWKFSPKISAILGYSTFNERRVAGEDMVTIQFDMDF
jgi:hypothetical protein